MTRTRATRRAFTLLEILLVLLIIGLLAGVAAVNFIGQAERARTDTTKSKLRTLKQQITNYNFATGSYPTSEEGLRALVPQYMEENGLYDSWNNRFNYLSPTGDESRPFEIVSAGPDGEFNTDDDISVWDIDQPQAQ